MGRDGGVKGEVLVMLILGLNCFWIDVWRGMVGERERERF